MIDKRRSKRIIKRLTVSFGVNGISHIGITHDVSKTGLFIRTDKFYSPGRIINGNLSIPNKGIVEFTGRVVRSNMTYPYTSLVCNGVAVEFSSVETAFVSFISNSD